MHKNLVHFLSDQAPYYIWLKYLSTWRVNMEEAKIVYYVTDYH